MKLIFIIITFTFLGNLAFGQAVNDDCFNAIDFGEISYDHNSDCIDGTVNSDTATSSTNVNATPSVPYYGMIGCMGYTTDNSVPSDDVWFRFKAYGFFIKIFPSEDLDTVHLNVWYGPDCNSLSASGCYTTVEFVENVYFSGPDSLDNWIYLQFSGKGIGQQGNFGFCLFSFYNDLVYYGTPVISSPTNVDAANRVPQFQLYPIPSNDYFYLSGDLNEIKLIQIFDVYGKEVYCESNINGFINSSHLVVGIYTVQLTLKNKFEVIRMVIK